MKANEVRLRSLCNRIFNILRLITLFFKFTMFILTAHALLNIVTTINKTDKKEKLIKNMFNKLLKIDKITDNEKNI